MAYGFDKDKICKSGLFHFVPHCNDDTELLQKVARLQTRTWSNKAEEREKKVRAYARTAKLSSIWSWKPTIVGRTTLTIPRKTKRREINRKRTVL